MAENAQSTPRIETLVVQPTPFCNINCRYCYLPDRGDKTELEQATVAALFRKVFDSGWAADHLTVIWHAGEPLVVPPSFYEHAFATIESLRPASVQIRHGLQTNGMLITPAWCDLFKHHDVGVGVSIDGPRAFHDANRVTRDGRGTFDKTLAGIRLLRSHGVPFHVICVLTAESIGEPEAMLRFFVEEGIEDVCFNVEESEGTHVSRLLAQREPQAAFRSFLETFWTLARRDGRIRFIREIDAGLQRMVRPEGTACRNEQVEAFGMLNMDCRGNVSSFSPELLGYVDADYDNFIVGNIRTHTLGQMLESPAMQAMARDIAAGVEACRRECEYFSVCGGGSPVNKLSENGSFATAATRFCALVQKVPTDLILESIGDFQQAGARGPAGRMPAPAVNP